MAVIETGAIFKSLRFDGIDSRSFGVYITGEAVYNAPTRDVNMIAIPGRNGLYAQDNGRFENITVTYPAGLFQQTDADFEKAISDFRNAICSRRGYCRLEDDYNTDEYRMAVYKNGLEVTPASSEAGEFSITFECKPQRFLKSGETRQTVTSGGTITNPTLHDAAPLIEVTGYGTLDVNGSKVVVTNDPLGRVKIADAQTLANESPVTLKIDSALLASGDPINLQASIIYEPTAVGSPMNTVAISNKTGAGSAYVSGISAVFSINDTFTRGTSRTASATFTITATLANETSRTYNVSVSVAYNGSDTFTFTRSAFAASGNWGFVRPSWTIGEVIANSSTLANTPITIDCENGEAYQTISGIVTRANGKVYLGATLPVLEPGANTLTFPNTMTVGIVPRWWIV